MKIKEKSVIKYLRLTCQIIFLLIAPIVFSYGFNGIKAIFINLGKGEGFSFSPAIRAGLVLIVFTIMFGRYFCGWVCAFGTMNDILYLFGSKFIKIKNTTIEKYDKYLKLIKYFILVIIMLLCFFGLSSYILGNSPWDVFGQIVSLKFRFAGLLVGIIIFTIIIIGCLFIERFFCRYLCPYGGIFSLVDKLNFFELHKPSEKCGKCRICTNDCPMGISLYENNEIKSGECIKCLNCTSTCPRKNIKFKIFNKEVNKIICSLIVIILMVILLFLVNIF